MLGSTVTARRIGPDAATIPVRSMTIVTAPKLSGSVGFRPGTRNMANGRVIKTPRTNQSPSREESVARHLAEPSWRYCFALRQSPCGYQSRACGAPPNKPPPRRVPTVASNRPRTPIEPSKNAPTWLGRKASPMLAYIVSTSTAAVGSMLCKVRRTASRVAAPAESPNAIQVEYRGSRHRSARAVHRVAAAVPRQSS